MNILQVMPIIIPHTSNGGSCIEIPQWLAVTIFVLIALVLLVILITLIKMIFDF